MTHALNYFLERTVICLNVWSVAQALLNFCTDVAVRFQRTMLTLGVI